MTKNELNQLGDKLYQTIDTEKAYFGFEEWTPHEFCIKANKDGLKSFAVELLEVCKSDIDGTKMNLQSGELKWLNDEIDIQFIELTNKSKNEILLKEDTKSHKNILTTVAAGLGLLILIYLFITGIIFTIQLF